MTDLARSVVELLAVMCVQGTVLAILALALVRAGALRPGWQAAVWLVVLAKFVLPWGPALPWSLADLYAALRSHDPGVIDLTPVAPSIASPPPEASPGWLLLGLVWLVGALIVLVRALAGQFQVAQAARRAPLAPAHARALLASFARRPPRLVVGDPATGPHVVGIVRPIIVIPPALLADQSLLCAALLHELAHVRRRDALARVVQVVASALFFFWPPVRLVNRRLDLSREAACDAWALETSEVPRPAYARLLVRMSQLRAAGASLAARCGLDARVAAVLGPPARARLSVVHRVALVAWVAVALGGARTAAARGEHPACRYTPELAEALRLLHPDADRDGDGVLTRDEACDYQAELRRKNDLRNELKTDLPVTEQVSRLEPNGQLPATGALTLTDNLLGEPLCCNCSSGAENSAPSLGKRLDACQADDRP